jgi:hypothetical protein
MTAEAISLVGYNQETSTEPGVFTEGQKRYKNKLMSIRPEPSAKVVTKTGTS